MNDYKEVKCVLNSRNKIGFVRKQMHRTCADIGHTIGACESTSVDEKRVAEQVERFAEWTGISIRSIDRILRVWYDLAFSGQRIVPIFETDLTVFQFGADVKDAVMEAGADACARIDRNGKYKFA